MPASKLRWIKRRPTDKHWVLENARGRILCNNTYKQAAQLQGAVIPMLPCKHRAVKKGWF